MNQIIFNRKINNKIKKFFFFQLVISLIIAVILSIYVIGKKIKNVELEKISHIINKKIKLESIYNPTKTSEDSSIYFGKIYIEKINLEYVVFKEINEELLKISPCKFYGGSLGEKGNICIAGHNYNDNRFFSRLDELKVNDEIVLEDLDENKYIYKIYNIYETDENNLSILSSNNKYELTLLTCNNSNKKRIIVKAFLIYY